MTPNLLFFCDYPPCSFMGGPVLMSRLLATYPPENCTVLTVREALRRYETDGRLKCKHFGIPRVDANGRLGLGRIKGLINWLLLLVAAISGVWIIISKKVEVVVTVAHGYFFLAATLACLITKTPFVLFIHDEWVARMKGTSWLADYFWSDIFKCVVNSASHIYVVSTAMQEFIKGRYGVDSEVQLPFIERKEEAHVGCEWNARRNIRIVYTGIGFGMDGLNLLSSIIIKGKLKPHGLDNCELHLYMPLDRQQVNRLGWDHEQIVLHGWVSQDKVRTAIATADLLYLPFSFEASDKGASIAFPTKTADYLASNIPMVICAPAYSSITQYAEKMRFARVITELSEEAMIKEIVTIINDKAYRQALLSNAKRTFDQNHDASLHRKQFLRRLQDIVYKENGVSNSDVISVDVNGLL